MSEDAARLKMLQVEKSTSCTWEPFFQVVVVEGGNCGMCMNVKVNQIIATLPDRGGDGNEGFFTFRLQ